MDPWHGVRFASRCPSGWAKREQKPSQVVLLILIVAQPSKLNQLTSYQSLTGLLVFIVNFPIRYTDFQHENQGQILVQVHERLRLEIPFANNLVKVTFVLPS